MAKILDNLKNVFQGQVENKQQGFITAGAEKIILFSKCRRNWEVPRSSIFFFFLV